MVESEGTLRYSPKKAGDKEGASPNWWVVVDCDPEIGAYYRHLYSLSQNRTSMLLRPAWKEHISVVRNEEPENKIFWERFNNQTVKFEFSPVAVHDDLYVWLPVKCPFLLDLREELGLPRQPQFDFHLTIGNLKKR